ncbi:hypothetical protein LTR08_000974 [Meristemomyces frigidus]|nr:hypothetical protein LTR08_000974 [Meristemomyces frigidus]
MSTPTRLSIDSSQHRVHAETPWTEEQRNAHAVNINDLPLEQSGHETSTFELDRSEKRSIVPPSHAWETLFAQEIAHDTMLEAQLMLMTVGTGILDATTFATFHVFATKQTGNTLFLALYAFNHPALSPRVECSVAVSIAAFVLGAAAFGHFARYLRQRRRAWLLASNLLQTTFLFAATAIRYWGPRTTTGSAAMGIVALLSFASGGQIVGSVGLGLPELNTTMITGTLVSLSNDPKLFHLQNAPRNRRLLFYASLLSGCFIGAAASRYSDASLGLLLAATVKAVAALSFFLNRGIVMANQAADEEKSGHYLPASGTATPVSMILWGD